MPGRRQNNERENTRQSGKSGRDADELSSTVYLTIVNGNLRPHVKLAE